MVGRTKENAPIFDMISKVRAAVQQTRQQFRDELPVKLAKAFSKPVSQKQWTAMFKSLGKTDLAVLVASEGVSGALEMITSPTRLNGAIQALEQSIQNVDGRRFAKIQVKSKQLAHYLNTGEHGAKLLPTTSRLCRDVPGRDADRSPDGFGH
jgi:hypothetical protein